MLSWLVPATAGATDGVAGVSAVGLVDAVQSGALGVAGTAGVGAGISADNTSE